MSKVYLLLPILVFGLVNCKGNGNGGPGGPGVVVQDASDQKFIPDVDQSKADTLPSTTCDQKKIDPRIYSGMKITEVAKSTGDKYSPAISATSHVVVISKTDTSLVTRRDMGQYGSYDQTCSVKEGEFSLSCAYSNESYPSSASTTSSSDVQKEECSFDSTGVINDSNGTFKSVVGKYRLDSGLSITAHKSHYVSKGKLKCDGVVQDGTQTLTIVTSDDIPSLNSAGCSGHQVFLFVSDTDNNGRVRHAFSGETTEFSGVR